MATPANSTSYAVYGQAFNFTACIIDITTGNPITGGLTVLTATISKDDGAFTAISGTKTEIGTTGYVSVDLSATEMTCGKAVVQVSCTNANARFDRVQINPLDLRPDKIHVYDGYPVQRYEMMNKDVYDYVIARNNLNASSQTIYNRVGTVKGTGVVVPGEASCDKGAIT